MNLVAASGRPRPRLLVCLDLQQANAPAGGDAQTDEVSLRLDNCRRVLNHARAWGWDIVHVHRRHDPDGGCARSIQGLEPRPCEPVMARDGLSAFSCRSFRELVDGAHDAEIVLIGFCAASSCLATLFGAHDRGLTALFVADAVAAGSLAALGPEEIEPVIRSIAAPFAEAVSTDQLIGRRRPPHLVVV
jgi:nicotinamidase-related amidase